MKQLGYFLIEMIAAIAIVTTTSLSVALIQGCLAQWHKEAHQYLEAVNIAQKSLAQLQKGEITSTNLDEFEVKVDSYKVHANIPFTMHSIAVSFKTPRGIVKKIIIDGGTLDEKG